MTTNNKKKTAGPTEPKSQAPEAEAPKARVIENEIVENIMKSGMDAAALGKENAELAAKSAASFFEGFQKMNNLFMGIAQESMKKNMAVAEAFIGAKDFNEVSDIQSKFARESFDAMVKNGTEISELTTKLTNEAVEPVRKQVTEAVEKMTKAAA
ncbi:phasin family protein [Kiloniella sp.]|uniref:phasin family protein n=1 Tax=Kiloniella sp. TaxID=1938587 RepID=UPI003B0107AD